RCNSPVQIVFLVPGICLRLYRYQHGDPDNVIAFTMVCCCASCDNSSGAVESPQPQPLGSLRALRTGPGGGVRAPLGPSDFLTTTEALEPRAAFAAIGDHYDRATADDGGFVYTLAFHLLLGRVYDDKDVQEWIVRRSKLDWVIVRPVILTDGAEDKRLSRVGRSTRRDLRVHPARRRRGFPCQAD